MTKKQTKQKQYVDGFVLSVPKNNKNKYKKMASDAEVVWKKFGALDYKECRADDMSPQFVTFKFPKMAKTKPSEEVWFSFIVYKSKAHRDEVNKNVMAFFEKKYGKDNMQMPFDMNRMSYGGFSVEVG